VSEVALVNHRARQNGKQETAKVVRRSITFGAFEGVR